MTSHSTISRSTRLSALRELLRARLLEFIREPAAVFWVYVFPLLMVVTLGIAFRSQPVERVTVDVQEGPVAEQVRKSLAQDPRFDVQISAPDVSRRRLRTGKTDLVIVPSGSASFESLTYRYDPTRPGSILARNAANDLLQRVAGREDVVATTIQEIQEPGGRYIDFLVPGLLGMGLMGGGMWGVGFAIVDMRIRKQLKRFLATPMKRADFLLAMMISRFLFTAPEVLVLLVFANLFFGVVIQGSLVLVICLILLGAFEFAGIGLLVASRAQTLETVSGLMNLVMLPLWIGSGIFFSTDRFPDFVQPLIKLLPLTPLITALRGVMLEGATLTQLTGELALIIGWGGITFGLALWLFRWK